MPRLRKDTIERTVNVLKNMVDRRKAKEAAQEAEKVKIKDKKDMADVQGAKEGGRIGLRGGGICKKGMNRKAVGKNS